MAGGGVNVMGGKREVSAREHVTLESFVGSERNPKDSIVGSGGGGGIRILWREHQILGHVTYTLPSPTGG